MSTAASLRHPTRTGRSVELTLVAVTDGSLPLSRLGAAMGRLGWLAGSVSADGVTDPVVITGRCDTDAGRLKARPAQDAFFDMQGRRRVFTEFGGKPVPTWASRADTGLKTVVFRDVRDLYTDPCTK